jgi:2,3-bisphosphoglycerate-independent phosphoglycerate mutase
VSKVIFIFLDGFGMGEMQENNPFVHAEIPFLDKLLGCRIMKGKIVCKQDVLLKGVDACLGVDGIPQSATGQTALFTGVNAAEILGYHLPAFPNTKLKSLINNSNIMKNAVSGGKKTVFANSYSQKYFEMVEAGTCVHSVTTLCVLSAGLEFRTIEDLKKGRAVHWDITNRYLHEQQNVQVSVISPEDAGKNLAQISANYDLVVYESFMPDLIGHKFDFKKAVLFLNILDRFLSGVYNNIDEDVTVVISSDHGNIEEIGNGGHTRNSVPLLVYGKDAGIFKNTLSITDIPAKIYEVLF